MENIARAIRKEKGNSGYKGDKINPRTPVCRWHIIQKRFQKFYWKTSRNNKFNNVAGYRIYLPKSITFLYFISKHTTEIMDTSPFATASKKKKK